MKKPTEKGLTKLANAAFEQAARKVIARAMESGTPVIVCVNEEVKAKEPRKDRRRNAEGGRKKSDHDAKKGER